MSRRAPEPDAVGCSIHTGAVTAMPPGEAEPTMPHHRDAIIDLEKLEQLSRAEPRALWTKELAEKPPPSLGRDILALGIAYARQENLYGGLSRRAAKELDRLLAPALGRRNIDTLPLAWLGGAL